MKKKVVNYEDLGQCQNGHQYLCHLDCGHTVCITRHRLPKATTCDKCTIKHMGGKPRKRDGRGGSY